MPIVFIHGVNVRYDDKYIRETKQRDELLAKIFYPLIGRELSPDAIFNTFWGDIATNMTPGSPFIPARPHLPISSVTDRLAAHRGSLLRLARRRPLHEVFDVMLATQMDSDSKEEPESISRLGLSLLRLSRRFKTLEDQLEWLDGMQDDVDFLDNVESEIAEQEGSDQTKSGGKASHVLKSMSWLKGRYGTAREQARSNLQKVRERLQNDVAAARSRARGRLKTVARTSRTATTAMAATTLTHPIRRLFHERMFMFIGDAFLYFGQRGTPSAPGPIILRVAEAMKQAQSRVCESDPEVIVIAHSMGGNIICDFASYFDPNTPIDLLITVGSQFPLFADLQMFPGLGTERPYAKPASVRRWINIYDMNDVFGFAASTLFQGIEDKHYASGKMGVTTHADCFKFISLYEHMAQAVLAK